MREKDGWRCRVCNRIDCLTAHHLYPQSGYLELKNVLVNGIICDKCHKRYHRDVQEVSPQTFIQWCEQQMDLITENRLRKINNICGALARYINAHNIKVTSRSGQSFDNYMQAIHDVSIPLPTRMYEQLHVISKKYQMTPEVYLLHFVKYQLKIN